MDRLAAALRRRAARYHEARHELEAALQYALASSDDEHAAHILSGFALDWLNRACRSTQSLFSPA